MIDILWFITVIGSSALLATAFVLATFKAYKFKKMDAELWIAYVLLWIFQTLLFSITTALLSLFVYVHF